MPNPARRLGAISSTHTDPDGHRWHLTVHWADVGGTATPVGLDLHAFTDDGRARVRPTGGVVTAAVLRSLRVAEVVEATRRQGAWTVPAAKRTTRAPRSTSGYPPKRPGRPAERGDDFIATVATLYKEAKAQGGEPARKPWLYVTTQLKARGFGDVTDGQLRNWSRRARNLGLIPLRERK
ncbi:hypothetical protein [Phytohabitans rumicis]|uniref:Uncharacterized protein n=1 Tax=Phytohabitans rumicis TaxID=1076125 RepID=A0A6V8LC73_9ACTN|nr:hypothetical protein [Phytohabitans rumicis]GFJ92189.1 hypothetical protein Prum_058310 [Phytohabitans rumicis]